MRAPKANPRVRQDTRTRCAKGEGFRVEWPQIDEIEFPHLPRCAIPPDVYPMRTGAPAAGAPLSFGNPKGAAMTDPVDGKAAGSPTAASRAKDVLDSPEFKKIVTTRWTVSMTLLAALFVTYYGFVLLIAGNKEAMSEKIGEVTTVAIPLGIAVIVIAFVLTAIYVAWANQVYDPEVKRLKEKLKP
jgi:uncharacterized membrane protein (DUF485 family)